LAISSDGERWWLLNASPDVLTQIQATPELWPRELRHSPIAGVVLTNGDLDHVLGLLLLRESQPLSVYATPRVVEGLQKNVALRTLERFPGQVVWRTLQTRETLELLEVDQRGSGIELTPFALAGKPPLHLMQAFTPSQQDNLGLSVRTRGGPALIYASAFADLDTATAFEQADALFVDGTFWSEEELPELGVSTGPASSMAHLPIGGQKGSLQRLRHVQAKHRYFTHINNSNPALDESSPEHLTLLQAGWQLATDGLRLSI
jgi:pyrroloquinoline quinone biosynthesis protein B